MQACGHDHDQAVVVIHGRAAAMEIEGSFEEELSQAMRFGLKRVGYDNWDCIPIRAPFYGRFWRPDEYLPVPVFDPGVSREGSIVATVGRLIEGGAEFADRLLNFSGGILELILSDTKEYFTREDLRKATDGAVREGFADAKKVVLVGFSMGSIIGYHVALTQPPPSPITALVTCGSPIASPTFYRHLVDVTKGGVPAFPPEVTMWANIWNDDDPATQVHDLTSRFQSDDGRPIQSARSYGRPPMPWNPAAAHNVHDYLSSKSLGAAVKTALRGEPG